MKSIVVDERWSKYCIICGKPAEQHHCIGGTANRKVSDKWGLIVPLCEEHHRTGKFSAHQSKEVGLLIHIISELAFEKHYIAEQRGLPFEDIEDEARNKFKKEFGKNYI